MKRILKFLLSLIMFAFVMVVHAENYDYHYSEWSEEYPEGIEEIAIESEDKYLCYREWYLDNGELQREETTEYFASLTGFNIIESTKKTFYRYITDDYVIVNGNRQLVYSSNVCIKNSCFVIATRKKQVAEDPPQEEIPKETVVNNPKTYDNIFVIIIVAFISLVGTIIVICSKRSSGFAT